MSIQPANAMEVEPEIAGVSSTPEQKLAADKLLEKQLRPLRTPGRAPRGYPTV